MSDLNETIQATIASAPVVLYMKGSFDAPACRFSAMAVHVLREAGVTEARSVDVLQDEAIRQGIKDFTGWPTLPQVFVGGEFLGGSDVIRALYESGELQEKLQAAGALQGARASI